MKILLLGGFPGSGKTAVLNRVIRAIARLEGTSAVIEGEIGPMEADSAPGGEGRIAVEPLFRGCACCKLSGDPVQAVGLIADEVNPDWLVAEMTGLAMMDGVCAAFRRGGRPDIPVHPVCVVDAARFGVLSGVVGPVLEGQLRGAELVLVNKADVVRPTGEQLDLIARWADGARVRTVSAGKTEDTVLWQIILEGIGEAQ